MPVRFEQGTFDRVGPRMSTPDQLKRRDPNEPARLDDHEGQGATRGTARMEAFADVVFAIAFTLPVVEIALSTPTARGLGCSGICWSSGPPILATCSPAS